MTSPFTKRRYGVQRVCRAWKVPRSTLYRRKQPQAASGPPKGRRGPMPLVTDAELLHLIRTDLESSPFRGEGHRKVWARLRVSGSARVSAKRVLRLMRENDLLSPHRVRRGAANLHDGRITTDRPNEMWATDGTRVQTVEDGWVWLFVAVEHWNAECVGWHVAKVGDRYAAVQPVSMAIQSLLGTPHADVARGIALRMDHGTQYTSDHFVNQMRYWGMSLSFALVSTPQTNGVVERFFRTLKEQAVHGRTFLNLEDFRSQMEAFINRYNENWRVEKLGYRTPQQARKDASLQMAA